MTRLDRIETDLNDPVLRGASRVMFDPEALRQLLVVARAARKFRLAWPSHGQGAHVPGYIIDELETALAPLLQEVSDEA
jgi:hypothetical protein